MLALPRAAVAQQLLESAERHSEDDRVEALAQRLKQGSFTLLDGAGQSLAVRKRGSEAPEPLSEQAIVETLGDANLTRAHAATLWEFFADETNASMLTLPIVKALIAASNTPKAREAFWSEVGGLAKEYQKDSRAREQSLLGYFERHRQALLPVFSQLRNTESSGDDMVALMLTSRMLGANFEESLTWAVAHNPAAVARRIERDRGRGQPVSWEEAAFRKMLQWKEERLISGAPKAPRSLADLDAAGEAYVSIFNNLHDLDPKYRKTMLRGLGPVEVFNAVVGGELELYRMGTSSYRDHFHEIILQGIKQSGSFEAFLERAQPRWLGEAATMDSGRRGMVLLRVVSSFGVLEELLTTVRDRERFVAEALASVGDPKAFEANGSVIIDLLTSRSTSAAAVAFRRALLDRLYDRFRTEQRAQLRSVYGSMLSVYQTVSGDRRDRSIDREFLLDSAMLRIPFERLFSRDGKSGLVHRIFMRMDEDVDAVSTYASFRALMRSRRASIQEQRHFDVFRISGRGRTIEIYANKPNAAGLKQGITDIAAALRGKRIETVVGRGHTSIVTPLQENAKRILGDKIKTVAAVLVGTCGGDASVRELIGTFGYSPFFTTRSTGRQIINNAIMDAHVASLMALPHGASLALGDVLERATGRFMQKGADEELRDDASFYRVSTAAVLSAFLFDTHVRRHIEPEVQVARQ